MECYSCGYPFGEAGPAPELTGSPPARLPALWGVDIRQPYLDAPDVQGIPTPESGH